MNLRCDGRARIFGDGPSRGIGPMAQPGRGPKGDAWGIYPIAAPARCGVHPMPRGGKVAKITFVEPDPSPRAQSVARTAHLIEFGRDREAAWLGAAPGNTASINAGTDRGAPMQPLDQLDQLGPLLAGVVTSIRPEQLELSTPCDRFTVGGVLDHMVGGATMFAAAFRGTAPGEPPADSLAAFVPVLTDLAAAMHEPGALDRTIASPFGDVDGETFARFVVLDGLVHGWDLATATGQRYEPPDALVADVVAFASGALDALRDGDTFATATATAASATPMERLAALTGRSVPVGR
jgi:uncharacterized protein (TIGR03086 family)